MNKQEYDEFIDFCENQKESKFESNPLLEKAIKVILKQNKIINKMKGFVSDSGIDGDEYIKDQFV